MERPLNVPVAQFTWLEKFKNGLGKVKDKLQEKTKVLVQNMKELAQKMQAVYSLTEPEKEEFYGHLVAWFHMRMKK